MLSCVILYCEKDEQYLSNCLQYLPADSEKILVKTVKTGAAVPMLHNVVRNGSVTKPLNQNGAIVITAEYHYNVLDMSDARNKAKILANGEWILSLDPDELLHPANHATIQHIISNTSAYGVYVNIYSYEPAFMLDSGFVPSNHTQAVRLFRKHPLINWKGFEDESIEYDLRENKRQIAQSDISIIHTGYSLTAEQMLEKIKYKIVRQAAEPRIFTEQQRFNKLLTAINNYNYLKQKTGV